MCIFCIETVIVVLCYVVQEDVAEAVRSLTGGNGVGRIVEASGAASLFNASFAWLRKVRLDSLGADQSCYSSGYY